MFIGGTPNNSTTDAKYDAEIDDSFLVIYHAGAEMVPFTVPDIGVQWNVELNTAHPRGDGGQQEVPAGKPLIVESRSLVVLRAHHA